MEYPAIRATRKTVGCGTAWIPEDAFRRKGCDVSDQSLGYLGEEAVETEGQTGG